MSVEDETWTVFRRYSRFRELHKRLKSKYPQVGRPRARQTDCRDALVMSS